MSRRIITAGLEEAQEGTVDGYFDKVLKYIPADIVTAWVTVTGLLASGQDDPSGVVLWIAFAVGIILTAVWIWRQTSVPDKAPATTQIVISTIAFVIWVFALGGPFANLDFYRPIYGSLLLIGYTLLVGAIDPPQ